MNSLTRSVAQSVPRAVRQVSTVAAAPVNPFRPKGLPTFEQTWFGDVGAYPVMAIIVIANIGWVSFLSYKAAYCPNVRFTNKTRGKVIRDWK